MKTIGIYKITNIVNGKIYVGSSKNVKKRINEHKRTLKLNKHHSCLLQRAVNKYGFENFTFNIIEECEQKDLIITEQKYIDGLKPEYNILKVAYSNYGHKLSEETKKLISQKLKGIKHGKMSDETKKKIAEANTGNVPSNDTRMKMSQKRIGIKLSQETKNRIKMSADSERCRRAQKKMVEVRKTNGTYGPISEKLKNILSDTNSTETIGIDIITNNIKYSFKSHKEASIFLCKSEVTLWRMIKNKKIVKNCLWMKKKDFVE